VFKKRPSGERVLKIKLLNYNSKRAIGLPHKKWTF